MNFFVLSDEQFHGSEACLTDFIKARANTKPHLAGLRLFHPCQPKVSAGQLTLQVTEGQRHASRTVRRHALQYSRGGVTAGNRQNGAKLD